MSEQEHIFYLLRRIPRNDEWTVFLELMMEKNATLTATSEEIVNKLVEMEAASRERQGSLQKLSFLQRRVAKTVLVVMATKQVEAAKVQGGIREIIRETTIGKRRISGSAFIATGEGTPSRTA
jgi:hypothetical protein